MTDETTAAPAAQARQNKLKADIRAAFEERRDACGWTNAKGKLTAKGSNHALEWLVGVAIGLQVAGHPDAEWLGRVAWFASIRGTDEAIKDL